MRHGGTTSMTCWVVLVLGGCGDVRMPPPTATDAGPGGDEPSTACVREEGNPFDGAITLDDECVAAMDPSALAAGATPCHAPALVTISRVIDGDTVFANDGDTLSSSIRIIGVNTPETVGMVECYGETAHAFTQQLEGHKAWLTFDETCLDPYDRMLAYVYIGPGSQDLWERQLLRRGLGRLLIIAPNDAQRMILGQDEFIARRDSIGLWADCP